MRDIDALLGDLDPLMDLDTPIVLPTRKIRLLVTEYRKVRQQLKTVREDRNRLIGADKEAEKARKEATGYRYLKNQAEDVLKEVRRASNIDLERRRIAEHKLDQIGKLLLQAIALYRLDS